LSLFSSRGICFPTRIDKRIQETLSIFFLLLPPPVSGYG
jgi:hypothetical protein